MLGIVILNYINWGVTIKCVESVIETAKNIDYHIYLVDNASPNSPPEKILEIINFENITFIENKHNKGYSAGNNVGIKKAIDDNCEEILISNSDIIFIENSISNMQKYLKSNTDVGIVGPKLFNLKGNVETPSMLIKTGLKEKYLVRTSLRKFFKRVSNKYYCYDINLNKPLYVHAVSGSCFMMSRICAIDMTPFDENTFLFEEELIIGVQMEKKAYKTVYLPEASVIHAHGESTKSIKAFSFICFVKSEMYYCKKYLNASLLALFPLYLIRSLSYCVRAIKHQDFRKNFHKYIKETGKDLIKKY